mgnify:CR=1 FL=1
MRNSKSYTPQRGARIYQALELMSDGRVRRRTEICEALALKQITYQRSVYEPDPACVDCHIGYHSYAHVRVTGQYRQFSGAPQLFLRLMGHDSYWKLPAMLERVVLGRY